LEKWTGFIDAACYGAVCFGGSVWVSKERSVPNEVGLLTAGRADSHQHRYRKKNSADKNTFMLVTHRESN
jgi:hypothetical protein